MSTKTHEAYEYFCDGCEERYEDCDFTIFMDDPDFWNQDWEYEGDVLSCPKCRDRLLSLCVTLAGEEAAQ